MSESKNKQLTCLLITANVGTIFEESSLLELWFAEMKSYLTKVRPQFVAIHCQEIGGKNYTSSMKQLSNFTNKIVQDRDIVASYNRVLIYLDEDFESLEKFTALGSLYLIDESVDVAKMYNFKTAHFDKVPIGHQLKSFKSSLEQQQQQEQPEHVEKVKFPQDLFPESRWSRKGFMRTRWMFEDSQQPLDLVNIHLFHDASNIVAMKQTPSPYARDRQRALEFTLRKISEPLEMFPSQGETGDAAFAAAAAHHDVPLFIFGDFNFRLDTSKVIERITEGVLPEIKRSDKNDEVVEFIYRGKDNEPDAALLCKLVPSDSPASSCSGSMQQQQQQPVAVGISPATERKVVMTIGKKLFDYENLDETFRAAKNCEWLQEMDNELKSFKEKLFEFKIAFSPSYPFKEDTTGAHSYMKTRCPAWCDRILFNSAGGKLIYSSQKLQEPTGGCNENKIQQLQSQGDVQYSLMGNCAPMGDHKPVILYCKLALV